MLATAIILFREVLEAALIISIVLAATKGVVGRGLWVSLGILLGITGACVVAVFAGSIAESLDGRGQELFNASILLTAVVMLGWHNIWMSHHGKELTQQMTNLGKDIAAGHKTLYVLFIVVMAATLREGSEIVLFGYGIYASGTAANTMLIGACLGLAMGILAGVLLYRGLLIIPARYLFSVTGWMILLLAAGLSASAAGQLTQAGLLPPIIDGVWDTGWLLNENSIIGSLLHTLIGYNQRPSLMQIIFYITTILTILGLSKVVDRRQAISNFETAK